MSISGEEFEIEYLEEDADIVQQCVQNVETPQYETKFQPEKSSLLVERVSKKKRKLDDDDDYDPREEIVMQVKKRKSLSVSVNKDRPSGATPKTRATKSTTTVLKPPIKVREAAKKPAAKKVDKPDNTEQLAKAELRRNMDICIPDYEDPLCLPVKSIIRDSDDSKKVKNWNQLCINRLKQADKCLVPEKGETVRSQRTVVLRNMKHKVTGKIDTTIWSKVSVENKAGDRKSEVFQCILPKFRENKLLSYYLESRKKLREPVHMVNEVILCKEDGKDGEQLVTYKPQSNTAAVYKTLVREDSNQYKASDEELQKGLSKHYLKELTHCKMCAPCYQTSWRGQQTTQKKNIKCSICKRSYVSVYNLLAHVKSGHEASQVRKFSGQLSKVLAEMVEYHYKCRICNSKLPSIKALRKHVTSHQGRQKFYCEIGNHYVR